MFKEILASLEPTSFPSALLTLRAPPKSAEVAPWERGSSVAALADRQASCGGLFVCRVRRRREIFLDLCGLLQGV